MVTTALLGATLLTESRSIHSLRLYLSLGTSVEDPSHEPEVRQLSMGVSGILLPLVLTAAAEGVCSSTLFSWATLYLLVGSNIEGGCGSTSPRVMYVITDGAMIPA